MDYTRNEDKLCSATPCNYNHIWLVEETSEESGQAQYPVTLQEVKKYLRLEGYVDVSTGGAVLQPPITIDFPSGDTSVQNSLLAQEGVTISTVAREGVVYEVITSGTPGNRQVLYDADAGTLTFQNASDGETINVSYGVTTSEGLSTDEFDFDDDLLNQLIAEGTTWVEKFTELYLRPVSLQVVFTNGAGMLEFPGPVTGTKSINGEETGTWYGSDFPKLASLYSDKATATYTAGYNIQTCPSGLKDAIMAYIADAYENRGDEVDLAVRTATAARKAKPYRRAARLWG